MKIPKILDFVDIFSQFFYFGDQNHKISKFREGHFVDLDILHLNIFVLCAVLLKTDGLWNICHFLTQNRGRWRHKSSHNSTYFWQIVYFCTKDVKLMPEVQKVWKRYLIPIRSYRLSRPGGPRVMPPANGGLTRALLGGVWTPPLRFFEASENTAAHSAAGFSPTLPPIFSATFVKISTQCHVRSGHQVRSSDPTTK